MSLILRPELPGDIAAVRDLNVAAFPTPGEAQLVDRLREEAAPLVSLVAEEAGVVCGHILFSPVSLGAYPAAAIMGLAPMAVVPDRQHTGIGSALVRAGLARCSQIGAVAVVVLGHPRYYPRFGFVPSVEFGFDSEYAVAAEVFMAQELVAGALAGAAGTVRYHAAFAEL